MIPYELLGPLGLLGFVPCACAEVCAEGNAEVDGPLVGPNPEDGGVRIPELELFVLLLEDLLDLVLVVPAMSEVGRQSMEVSGPW